tara:strand:+ start:271 stop:453 length:183 start_codon:yes stop_codon:yes gene_type:complete
MKYILYNEEHEQRGVFHTVDALERYLDVIREQRGERYPETEWITPFDYIKSIKWYFDIEE